MTCSSSVGLGILRARDVMYTRTYKSAERIARMRPRQPGTWVHRRAYQRDERRATHGAAACLQNPRSNRSQVFVVPGLPQKEGTKTERRWTWPSEDI